ncbi:RidA family protein [Brevundimonas sp.]|jgi:enamine deaminase RidA (YjgF/YER057c/UK114 family)|uniref:RidA family protein n=1 Tax=Brevundimonas sp. TaxID=1871086 RepID=UPI0037845E43
MKIALTALTAALLLGAAPALAQSHDHAAIERTYGSPTAFIASTVTVPAGSELIFLSGQLPDVTDTTAPAGSVEAYGDTEAQSASTFAKIERLLATRNLTMGDVVSMTVYLTAAPGSERMDFAGMMRAYGRYFGTAEQPNRPSRSTVQVAGLAGPGFLVEIEVTAARLPAHAH